MVRLSTSALMEVAFLGNDVLVDAERFELTGVDAHGLYGARSGHEPVGCIAGEHSLVELPSDFIGGVNPDVAAMEYDECLSQMGKMEELRLAEDLKLRIEGRNWSSMLGEADLTLLKKAAAEAEAGRHDEAMMTILGQLSGDPYTGRIQLDDEFLRRWSLPLALLCGGHQLNHSLGFLYWMGRRLAYEPAELISWAPGLWLNYLHRCVVVGCYDILGDVLRQLIGKEPELARDALVYLFALRDLKVPAVCALRGNVRESLLLYFPSGNSRGVYGRYCNAVEQILGGGLLSPVGPGGESYGIIYDYARLHGYVYAVTSTLRSCFISKSGLKEDTVLTMELKLLQNVSDRSLCQRIRMIESTLAECRW